MTKPWLSLHERLVGQEFFTLNINHSSWNEAFRQRFSHVWSPVIEEQEQKAMKTNILSYVQVSPGSPLCFFHTFCLMRCGACLRWGVKVTLTLCPSLCARNHSTISLLCQCSPQHRAAGASPQPAWPRARLWSHAACRCPFPPPALHRHRLCRAPPYVLPSTVIHGGQRWEMPSGIVLAECSTPSGSRARCDTSPGASLHFDSAGI